MQEVGWAGMQAAGRPAHHPLPCLASQQDALPAPPQGAGSRARPSVGSGVELDCHHCDVVHHALLLAKPLGPGALHQLFQAGRQAQGGWEGVGGSGREGGRGRQSGRAPAQSADGAAWAGGTVREAVGSWQAGHAWHAASLGGHGGRQCGLPGLTMRHASSASLHPLTMSTASCRQAAGAHSRRQAGVMGCRAAGVAASCTG